MTSFAFYHNMDTCVGCCACQVACKDRNNLPTGAFFRRVQDVPEIQRFSSMACCHCEEPLCMAVCPNDAFYKAEDGTVLHDDGRCVGCGKCVWGCPYGAIVLHPLHGVAAKCDGCYVIRQSGGNPVCVDACINRSLQYGKTDGRCVGDPLYQGISGFLPDPDMTHPRIRIHNRAEQELPAVCEIETEYGRDEAQ